MDLLSPNEVTLNVVHDLVAAWNDRDIDRFLGFLAEDVEWDDPAMPAPARGREAVRAFAVAVLNAFPDFSYTLRGPLCVSPDGRCCAVPWRIRGTHRRPLPPGYAPTGRTACFDGVDWLEFRDGRVARINTYFDLREAAGQLLGISLRPRPGSLAARLLVWSQRVVAAAVRLAGRCRRD